MARKTSDAHDAELLAEVRAALRSEPLVGPKFHASELRIEPDGALVLAGEVESVAAKKLALERVGALPEINAIVDRLHVRPVVHMSDKEIRAHLGEMLVDERAFLDLEIRLLDGDKVELLRGAPAARRGHIDFEVIDGVVTLDGAVPGLTTKRLAGVMAWWIPGVRDVVNGIGVEPPEDDGPDMIAEAARVVLEKDPFVNAGQIRVGVRNTLVRLTGLVPTQVERQAAERDMWCIFGVDKVINKVRVSP